MMNTSCRPLNDVAATAFAGCGLIRENALQVTPPLTEYFVHTALSAPMMNTSCRPLNDVAATAFAGCGLIRE